MCNKSLVIPTWKRCDECDKKHAKNKYLKRVKTKKVTSKCLWCKKRIVSPKKYFCSSLHAYYKKYYIKPSFLKKNK